MKIIVAEHSGFCFGVNRAVDTAEELVRDLNGKTIYSLGPLIHNSQAVKSLENKGLKPIENIEELLKGEKLIIRSHGVSPSIEEKVQELNVELVDTTCPYVKAVHKRVRNYKNKDYKIVIIGDREHPEVIGINGHCDNEGIVINTLEEATNLPKYDKICVVSQTTNTWEKFDAISKILLEKANEVEIFNTICNATSLRQNSAMELAKQVDAMVVIGGYHSSNTNKLVEVSKKYCKNVYHIEKKEELPLQELSNFNTIGITAGASTPDWIIKEVINTMDNINNGNEIMEAIENSMVRIHRGDILKGKVIYVTDNEVMVNINYKSDGIIIKEELSNDPDIMPKDLFNEGDEIEVYVVRIDDGEGNVMLSTKRVEAIKNWDTLAEMYEKQEEVECKVLKDIKGGLSVSVMGITGFMPASQISVEYIEDLSIYKGRVLESKIIDFDQDKRRIILSSRIVEEELLEKKRNEIWDSLEIGEIIKGRVARLTDFGAFVDLGGLDGLIHISDLSWFRINHPSEVVEVDEDVEVEVLDFNKAKNRISLGLKQTLPKPWDIFIEKRSIGDIVSGKIVNMLDFGAFVRLEEGVDGLVHVSQISKEHVNKPSDVLEMGEEVQVKIIDINEEEKRISLSMRELEEDIEETIENEELEVSIGDIVKDN
ncbi:MAG: bifunctional 4-hydroxy-3-methylbut-2-enyl diphosphate reductase/30S ribosomal protein S1 [Tissierellia bacterium]|nr:bifunctional 4-hydroxy-3-methylbut-2-enyl diphosphate reductase/30S ribosomal protein S1 [Tissierellia bacterium]